MHLHINRLTEAEGVEAPALDRALWLDVRRDHRRLQEPVVRRLGRVVPLDALRALALRVQQPD